MADFPVLNKREIAALVGVSEPTIAKWVDKQGAPCLDRGGQGLPARFDAPEFVAWWRTNVVLADAPKAGNREDRLGAIELEMKEIALHEKKGLLVDRAAAVSVIAGLLTTVGIHLRQSPRRDAAAFVGLPDEAAAVEALNAQTNGILAELRVPEAWRELSAPDPVQDAEA